MQQPPPSPTGRAICYARVSTQEQVDGYSLDSQEAACIGYARAHGYIAVQVVREEGASGATLDRPALRAMLDDLSGVSALIVWRIDRISRSLRDLLGLVHDDLIPRGIRLLSVTEQIDVDSLTGRLMLGILGSFAEYERAVIRSRSMEGKRRRVRAGLWDGAAPYGYRIGEAGALEPSSEADVVHDLFRRYAHGDTITGLVHRLNERGIPSPRGSQWTRVSVGRILSNDSYIGHQRLGDETLRARHKPLVSAAVWRAVSERLEQARAMHPRQRASSWAPLYRCGHCGSGMGLQTSASSRGTAHTRYACAARLLLPTDMRHSAVSLARVKADDCLWAAVRERVIDGAIEQWLTAATNRAHDPILREREAELRNRLGELSRQVSYNLRAAREAAIDPLTLREENAPLLAEQQRVEAALATLATSVLATQDGRRLRAAIPADAALAVLSSMERRDLLLALIDRVDVLTTRWLRVWWRIPGTDPMDVMLPVRYRRT